MVKKKETKQPTSIDLFAGAGGMTEGLRKAGFKSVLANEYDEMAGFTFKTNHPNVPLVIKDVKDLSVEEVLEITTVHLVCVHRLRVSSFSFDRFRSGIRVREKRDRRRQSGR